MKRIIKWLPLSAVLLCALLAAVIVRYAIQYQSLQDDSGDISLAPDMPDIVYCTIDGVSQPMDIYRPTQRPAGRIPVLVYVHGGSFVGGDKRKGSGVGDIPAMVARGYMVAAINYRLAPTYYFPAPLEDVKCAIRYLRANAAQYGLDAERIGIWGGSAGGHLAAMAGLTGDGEDFVKGGYADQSSGVAAVVDMFGPSDLAGDFNWLQTFLLGRAFGTTDKRAAILARASPVNYVSAHTPPMLIMHGDQDDVVPVSQSYTLYERLRAAGAPVELAIVKNANHNFAPTGGVIDPPRATLTRMMAEFFDKNLD